MTVGLAAASGGTYAATHLFGGSGEAAVSGGTELVPSAAQSANRGRADNALKSELDSTSGVPAGTAAAFSPAAARDDTAAIGQIHEAPLIDGSTALTAETGEDSYSYTLEGGSNFSGQYRSETSRPQAAGRYFDSTWGLTVLCPATQPRKLPNTDEVNVRVYNSTTRYRLAANTAWALSERGFNIFAVANDPLGRSLPSRGVIYFGSSGKDDARLLKRHVSNVKLVRDQRTDSTVDLVLGWQYDTLASPEQAELLIKSYTEAKMFNCGALSAESKAPDGRIPGL